MKYEWYEILVTPALYAIIGSILINLRFSYFASMFTYQEAKYASIIVYFVSIVMLIIISIVFPAKIGHKISENVGNNKLAQGSLSGAFYAIETSITSFCIIIITSIFTSSPYIIADAFTIKINLISNLIISLLFILISSCSAFIGAFKQTKSAS